MKYSATNKPLVCMMTQSTCYRGTKKMDVKGVLWHSTGANNPNLKRYVQPDDNAPDRAALLAKLGTNAYKNDWNHIYREAGLNCWIGKFADGTVGTVQTMPWDYKPWGCGSGSKGSLNNGFIQFEIAEDSLNDKKYFEAAYKEACEITAYLCKLYNIDPNGTVNVNGVKVPTILCHQDSYKLGLGSNHSDVYNWFNKYGKTMANARADVAALIKGSTPAPTPTPTPTPTTTFKAGDLVSITGNTYYAGATIPNWVKAKNWYVTSVKGDRVVVDKSEDGKDSICSAINAANLKLANKAPATPAPTTPATPEPAKPTTPAKTEFKAGDVVKITGTKYYSGSNVPDWVKSLNWVVKSVSGDRVVIDKSEDGKRSIMSPFKASDLALVTKPAPETPKVNNTIEVGDTVKITGTKYYSGATMPAWVRAKNWIVYSAPAGSDRVVIDKSADGKSSIMSPVKRSDLAIVKKH